MKLVKPLDWAATHPAVAAGALLRLGTLPQQRQYRVVAAQASVTLMAPQWPLTFLPTCV